jgi:ribosomal protein S18 acetylase RimI-like enzyme
MARALYSSQQGFHLEGVCPMPMLLYRPVELPADGPGIEALDTSFESDCLYAVAVTEHDVSWRLVAVSPFTKRYDVSDWQDPERLWEHGWVATRADQVVGFLATRWDSWNRRGVVWHFYVDRAWRRQGIARNLLELAEAAGRTAGVRLLWLEVSNRNVPAIAAYRALGFRVVGADTTLYTHTSAADEVALFMARPVL